MRIGATKRPQCTGALYNGVGTCALGAVYEALGQPFGAGMLRMLGDALAAHPPLSPFMLQDLVVHPVTGSPTTLYITITQLNDAYSWSRAHSADWLSGLEGGA